MLKRPSSYNTRGNNPQPLAEVRVLAIEDDEDDKYLLARMLDQDSSKCYALKSTDTLTSGIEVLKEQQFDVVLLDLGLEESQGLATLQNLLKEGFSIPVIVLTGTNQVSLGEQAIKAGAEDFLPKFEASPSLLARSIAYAIERHRLIVQLKNQALTDPLTHLPNRTAIFERLDSLINDNERSSINFGIGLLDLDGFKNINDTLGHQAGDDLLRQVAARLQKNLRKSDMVARLGGDEFIILVTYFHNTREFIKVLEKKQRYLRQPLAVYAEKVVHQVNISGSVGACKWHAHLNAHQLTSLADKAMYQSKREGGRVILAEYSEPTQAGSGIA